MKLNYLLLPAFLLIVIACANDPEPSPPEEVLNPGPKIYQLTPIKDSKKYKKVKIDSWNYQEGVFSFLVNQDSYRLGAISAEQPGWNCPQPGMQNHFSLIVDNYPYKIETVSEFEVSIPSGEHYVLGLLSNDCSGSVKTDDSHILKKILIRNDSLVSVSDINYPMIFYNLPRGTYRVGPDNHMVLLDFFLTNVNLGKDFLVKVEVNDEVQFIDKWQSYIVNGLHLGINKIKLTLTNKNGQLVEVPLNPVEREFILELDSLAQPMVN